jgi:hypothetical protein
MYFLTINSALVELIDILWVPIPWIPPFFLLYFLVIIPPFFLYVCKYLPVLFPFLKLSSSSTCFFLCIITFSSFLYALIFQINEPIYFFYKFPPLLSSLHFSLFLAIPLLFTTLLDTLFVTVCPRQYILVTKQCPSCLGNPKALKTLKIHKVTSKFSHLCPGLPRSLFP